MNLNENWIWLFVLVGWIICAGLARLILSRKGRSYRQAFLTGLLLGPLGLIIAVLAHSKKTPAATPTIHPDDWQTRPAPPVSSYTPPPAPRPQAPVSDLEPGEIRCVWCREIIPETATDCPYCQAHLRD